VLKVDPPTQVIDSFRTVQAAKSDAQRAQTYAKHVIPEGRGKAAQIRQAAEPYREQTVAEATGQAARFLKVLEEYKKAPDVSRQRIYLETMAHVLGGTDKILLNSNATGSGGTVPYLPFNELTHLPQPGPARESVQTGSTR
jgi:modulator of FtsH protease HflK